MSANSYPGYKFDTRTGSLTDDSGYDHPELELHDTEDMAGHQGPYLNGGAGTDIGVLGSNRSSYSVSLSANGDVVATSGNQKVTLHSIEKVKFGDNPTDVSIMDLLPVPHISTSDAQSYNAKVQAYFIGTLGRAATTSELNQFTSLLTNQKGNVWVDSDGHTGTSNSLVAYLADSKEFAKLTANKNSGQVADEMYQRLTGDLPSQTLHNYYQTKLDAGTIKARGLLNAMLNDLSIMPRADGTLSQPSDWKVNMHTEMEPVELVGMVNKLHAVGYVGLTNLDASGNLS